MYDSDLTEVQKNYWTETYSQPYTYLGWLIFIGEMHVNVIHILNNNNSCTSGLLYALSRIADLVKSDLSDEWFLFLPDVIALICLHRVGQASALALSLNPQYFVFCLLDGQ